MEKLCKYEINQIIGGDNLFGEYLNKTSTNVISSSQKQQINELPEKSVNTKIINSEQD